MARDRVIVFDSSQVLANFQEIVDPKYSRDFLHINSEGYVALDKAIAGILVRSRITLGWLIPFILIFEYDGF